MNGVLEEYGDVGYEVVLDYKVYHTKPVVTKYYFWSESLREDRKVSFSQTETR